MSGARGRLEHRPGQTGPFGSSRALPIVVASGLAVGVFAGLWVVRQTSAAADNIDQPSDQTSDHAGSSGPGPSRGSTATPATTIAPQANEMPPAAAEPAAAEPAAAEPAAAERDATEPDPTAPDAELTGDGDDAPTGGRDKAPTRPRPIGPGGLVDLGS